MDPSDAAPSTLTVSPSEELEAAWLALGSGSTLMLERGDFELDETLAVQRPLTIVGAGRRVDAALLAPGTSRVIRDSMVHDNATGGILVAGREAPRMTAVRASGTRGCGVCWAESAGGSLSDSIVECLDAGVRVEGRATPRVLRTTIRRPRCWC